jgi:hypothetical protein
MTLEDAKEAFWADWLETYLRGCGAAVAREVRCGSAFVDLVVEAEYRSAVEVKRAGDRDSLLKALGQAVLYQSEFERVGVAIPAGTRISDDLLDGYERTGVQVIEMRTQGFTQLEPAFPYLWGTTGFYPWGQVYKPNAHVGAPSIQPVGAALGSSTARESAGH